MKFLITFSGTFITLLFFLIFLDLPKGTGEIIQPIQFNHKLHKEIGLECKECHETAYTSSQATIPDITTCLGCHEDAQTKSLEEEKIRKYAREGKPIPWVKVHSMPAYVFFTHRIHTTIGGIPCSSCHGDVASRAKPFVKPEVDLSMDFCIDCHNHSGINEDCSKCHK